MTKFYSSCLFPIKFPPMYLPDGLELFERGRQFLKGHWQTCPSYWAGRVVIQLSPPGPWTLTVALLSQALLPSIDSKIQTLFFIVLSQPPPCLPACSNTSWFIDTWSNFLYANLHLLSEVNILKKVFFMDYYHFKIKIFCNCWKLTEIFRAWADRKL